MKKDGIFMRSCLFIICLLLTVACSDHYMLIDDEVCYFDSCNVEITSKQLSKLTYGLFDNLGEQLEFDEDEKIYCTYSSWWPLLSNNIGKSGCGYSIEFYCWLSNEGEIEVNRRLSALFPHSKISNGGSYRTYYDNNNNSVVYLDTNVSNLVDISSESYINEEPLAFKRKNLFIFLFKIFI